MSTDETPSILANLSRGDSLIQILPSNERLGSAKANFCRLLRNTDAPYVMLCDQDDYWLPSKVDKSISALRELELKYGSEVPLLVFCDMKVVDKDLRVLHESFESSSNFNPKRLSFRYLVAQNVAAGCCMAFNRRLVEIFLYATNSEPMDMHDWWIMLVASAFGHVRYIDEPLSLYRQHGDNEVGANDYSPLNRVKNLDFMFAEFLKTTRQAEAFCAVYSSILGDAELATLKNFSSIEHDLSPISSLVHLAKSGCWKKGMRKFGQIAISVMISINNRRRL